MSSTAVLHLSSTQAPSPCTQATVTIGSQADAAAFTSCATISGTVLISPSATGEITLDGPQQITGDFDVSNAMALTYLGSPSLTTIGGTFTLQDLPLLSAIDFISLANVGTVVGANLPAASGTLSFPGAGSRGFQTKSFTLFGTALVGLDFSLGGTATVNITNNPGLSLASINMTSVTSSLTIASNNFASSFSFPGLVWAANITASDLYEFSVPDLAMVNGSFGLYGNTFPSFSAPKLTSVGSVTTGQGALSISNNTNLTGLSMPLLSSVGGSLEVEGNGMLETISLPALADAGKIILIGNFSTPSLGSLSSVKNGFDLESNSTSVDCLAFQKAAWAGLIHGPFVCKSGNSSSTGSGTGPTQTGLPNPNPGLSTDVKIGIGVSILLLFIIVAAVIILLWKKGYKLSVQRTLNRPQAETPYPAQTELPLGDYHEKTELPAVVRVLQRPTELSGNSWGPVPEAYELYSPEKEI